MGPSTRFVCRQTKRASHCVYDNTHAHSLAERHRHTHFHTKNRCVRGHTGSTTTNICHVCVCEFCAVWHCAPPKLQTFPTDRSTDRLCVLAAAANISSYHFPSSFLILSFSHFPFSLVLRQKKKKNKMYNTQHAGSVYTRRTILVRVCSETHTHCRSVTAFVIWL